MSPLGENTCQDQTISARIAVFLHSFQHIEVRLPITGATVQVHPPYMLRSTSLLDRTDAPQHLQPRNLRRLQRARAAREAASPALRGLLAKHFYDPRGVERSLARGRAEPGAIQALLQEALDLELVPAARGGLLDGQALRQWLKQYGIGVDCSGFVQQALQHLGLTTPFLRCPRVYRAINDSAAPLHAIFREVACPGAAQPGDVLVNPKHMRIIQQVGAAPDGGRLFHLAESTSARDIPTGCSEEEEDIGPRLIQVRYPRPNLPIGEQLPAWKRDGEGEYQPEEDERSYRIARVSR